MRDLDNGPERDEAAGAGPQNPPRGDHPVKPASAMQSGHARAAGSKRKLNNREFCAGLMFVVFGVAALILARGYAVGSAVRMGPGLFPTLLGSLLIGLGTIIAVRGLLTGREGVPAGKLRPLLVLVAVAAFALLLKPLGLAIAAPMLVMVGAAAGPDFQLREGAALAILLTGLSAALFVYALGLPIQVWPG